MTQRSIQFNVRVTVEQEERLVEIAKQQGFLGGPGLRPDEPNRSLAARWLWGKADKVMADHDVSLEWDRS